MAEPSNAYGPVENADDTRQAQQGILSDATLDVNANSVVLRSQVLTFDLLGKIWTANADRREKLADHVAFVQTTRTQ